MSHSCNDGIVEQRGRVVNLRRKLRDALASVFQVTFDAVLDDGNPECISLIPSLLTSWYGDSLRSHEIRKKLVDLLAGRLPSQWPLTLIGPIQKLRPLEEGLLFGDPFRL